ncbi:hypothetical protein ACFLR5_00155, partial [Elusimicrobiota bacterium]
MQNFKNNKSFKYLLLSIIIILLIPVFSLSAESVVRISEVAPVETNDWIELFISTETSLNGWKLYEGN